MKRTLIVAMPGTGKSYLISKHNDIVDFDEVPAREFMKATIGLIGDARFIPCVANEWDGDIVWVFHSSYHDWVEKLKSRNEDSSVYKYIAEHPERWTDFHNMAHCFGGVIHYLEDGEHLSDYVEKEVL